MKTLFNYINEAARTTVVLMQEDLQAFHIWEPVKRLDAVDMVQIENAFEKAFKWFFQETTFGKNKVFKINNANVHASFVKGRMYFEIYDRRGELKEKDYEDIILQIIETLGSAVESRLGTPEDIKKFVRIKIK